MMKSILVIIALLFTYIAIAQEEKKQAYDEKEFRAKLLAEVEKRLIKLGRKKIVEFSKELLNKEEELRLSKLEIEKERQQLDINKKTFSNKVKEFHVRQKKLLSCIDNIDKEQNKRISHMVDIISGMKADKAASILSVQEADISVQILGLLDATKVSKIFNLMDKEISARLQKQYMTMKR